MTPQQIEYAEYLQGEHWQKLRRIVINRDGRKCARCPERVRLQAHHRFYRARWEDSIPDDLITLCRACHEKEHGIVPCDTTSVLNGTPPVWITSLRELQSARSLHKITRRQFLDWKQHFMETLPALKNKVAGSVGNRRWNQFGQKMNKWGRVIKFGRKKSRQPSPLTKREMKIRRKYQGWAMSAFRR